MTEKKKIPWGTLAASGAGMFLLGSGVGAGVKGVKTLAPKLRPLEMKLHSVLDGFLSLSKDVQTAARGVQQASAGLTSASREIKDAGRGVRSSMQSMNDLTQKADQFFGTAQKTLTTSASKLDQAADSAKGLMDSTKQTVDSVKDVKKKFPFFKGGSALDQAVLGDEIIEKTAADQFEELIKLGFNYRRLGEEVIEGGVPGAIIGALGGGAAGGTVGRSQAGPTGAQEGWLRGAATGAALGAVGGTGLRRMAGTAGENLRRAQKTRSLVLGRAQEREAKELAEEIGNLQGEALKRKLNEGYDLFTPKATTKQPSILDEMLEVENRQAKAKSDAAIAKYHDKLENDVRKQQEKVLNLGYAQMGAPLGIGAVGGIGAGMTVPKKERKKRSK